MAKTENPNTPLSKFKSLAMPVLITSWFSSWPFYSKYYAVVGLKLSK